MSSHTKPQSASIHVPYIFPVQINRHIDFLNKALESWTEFGPNTRAHDSFRNIEPLGKQDALQYLQQTKQFLCMPVPLKQQNVYRAWLFASVFHNKPMLALFMNNKWYCVSQSVPRSFLKGSLLEGFWSSTEQVFYVADVWRVCDVDLREKDPYLRCASLNYVLTADSPNQTQAMELATQKSWIRLLKRFQTADLAKLPPDTWVGKVWWIQVVQSNLKKIRDVDFSWKQIEFIPDVNVTVLWKWNSQLKLLFSEPEHSNMVDSTKNNVQRFYPRVHNKCTNFTDNCIQLQICPNTYRWIRSYTHDSSSTTEFTTTPHQWQYKYWTLSEWIDPGTPIII